MSDFQKMLEQAQRMQAELEKAQDEMADLEVSYHCNGVDVVVAGDFSVKSINISEDLVREQDRDLLQDVVLTAVNGGIKKARDEIESRMEGIAGGLRIPGMF